MKEELGKTALDDEDKVLYRRLLWPCVGLDVCAGLIIMLAPAVPALAAWKRSAFQGVCVLTLIAVNICLGMSIRP